MSIAHGLFQKFRAQRDESSRPYRTQYSEFLRELSRGEEVDLESLEICCRALGIDERKLQSDVELQSRRIQSQATIQQAEQASIELSSVEQQIAQLRREQDEFNQRTNAQLHLLRNQELSLQGAVTSGDASKIWLRQNILDSELLQRIADHQQRRRELLDQQRRCEENLASRYDSRLNAVRSARVQIPILKSFKRLDSLQQRQLREHEENLRLHSGYVEQMESELAEVKQRFAMLDVESEQLERQKLEA